MAAVILGLTACGPPIDSQLPGGVAARTPEQARAAQPAAQQASEGTGGAGEAGDDSLRAPASPQQLGWTRILLHQMRPLGQ